jgi:hypothetical protein
MAQRELASLLIFGPLKGLLNIQTGGVFRPYGFIANRLAGISPVQRSVFGKVALQRADLKIPAQIGADALGGRHST